MMDTGKGGCNGNILFGNDFSHSPCNAIEATFSRNAFLNNKLVECWHGVWGGYSFDTNIVANLFAYNGEGISIEHGQNNSIVGNRFLHENTAINLWQDPIADPNWTYLKHHDTVSRDYQISFNLFENSTGPAISVKDTKRVLVGGNTFTQCASAINQAGDNEGSQFDLGSIEPGPPQLKTITPGGQPISGTSDAVGAYLRRFDIPWTPFLPEARLRQGKKPLNDAERRFADAATWVRYNTWWSNDGARGALSPFGDKDAQSPFLKSGALRGQRYIFVDQWGPYDFKSPLLWPRQKLSTSPRGTIRRRFEILGPVGKWRLVSKAGVLALSHESGPVPGIVDIDFPAAEIVRTDVHLEYTGSETADYRGIVTPAGKPVRFDYHEFHVPIDWDVKFFKWDSATDPRTQDAAFRNLISGVPIKEVHLTKLDYAGGTFDREVGPDHFATICTGSFSVPAGKYTFELTTDDGARAWVDGKPVVTTAWKYQGPTLYTAKLSLDGSKHTIRVEHFQIDGYAALKVRITKG
jgi:hypothetical protein